MHASTILSAAVLAGAALAVPAKPDTNELWTRDEEVIGLPRDDEPALVRRDGEAADATSPWVSVDSKGQPVETYTPSITTDRAGATGLADSAPHDLTASVYTWTSYAAVTTSTGDPPNPTATAKGGEGAFSRCYNTDGDFAPFCRPSHNTSLYTGNTYYVTWDPDYYNTTETRASNTTYNVALSVTYLNLTTNEWLSLQDYDKVPAAWGFWPFKVETKHLKGHKTLNITITLDTYKQGTNEKVGSTVGLPAAIVKPTLPKPKATPKPSNTDLIIALPVTFGSLALILFGVCLWNRKTRRIQLGDVMSRARRRNGYTGRSARRMWRKDNGIQLSSRMDPPTPDYSDELSAPRPHRDSDDLGSLAGSPVDASFHNQGSGNAFRDEVARQRLERQDDNRFI